MKHAEFDALFEEVSNWGRWGAECETGALNFITPEKVAAAARGVTLGVSVSLSHPLDTIESIDNDSPAEHRMTVVPDRASDGVEWACDYIGLEMHGEAHSHIDALCHVAYRGRLFNGVPVDAVSNTGARFFSADAIR